MYVNRVPCGEECPYYLERSHGMPVTALFLGSSPFNFLLPFLALTAFYNFSCCLLEYTVKDFLLNTSSCKKPLPLFFI